MSAFFGAISPVTKGLFFVRSIKASMSRSINMLMALAPPAAKDPPTKVIAINHTDGQPPAATTIVGTVVISNNSMIRGFVNAT